MDGYVTIHGWMLELGLNGRELNALAVIWSYGKDGGWFQGSASYLAKWMGVKTKHTVFDALTSLMEKGIIEKRERWEKGKRYCEYRPVQKLHQGDAKNASGVGAKNGLHKNRPDSDSNKNKEIYKESFTHLPVDDFIRSIR
jgi:hypothetical protein